LGVHEAAFGGFQRPGQRERGVFFDVLTVVVHAAEHILRGQIALIGRFFEPADRLRHIGLIEA